MTEPVSRKLTIDDDVAKIIRKLIPEDEEILWAVRQSGPSWRQWHVLLYLAWALLALRLLTWFWGPFWWLAIVLWTPAAIGLVWYAVGQWFYVFASTSRSVIILKTLWPRGCRYTDYKDMDENWVASHKDRGVIKFGGFDRHFEFRAFGPNCW